MNNAEENLNTESNDIAGNRIDGPTGNTAAQHNSSPGIGQPRTAAAAGSADAEISAASVSSESLAASETSVSEGAVETGVQSQENKEVNPADLNVTETYGGNFSNSTQGSYHDEDRRENQDSDPNRGEFGMQDEGGTTHGGFGNQNRLADYEPRDSAEDKYYGGPGATGPQTNSYRTYDGRDERPDARTDYGFDSGNTATPTGSAADTPAAHLNDNNSPQGPDSGYADDYGHTSLRPAATPRTGAAPEVDQRNQTEDYLPAQSGTDKQGHHQDPTGYSTNAPEMADQRGQGYGDRGRDQSNEAPDIATGDARNGYSSADANKGNSDKGIGSKGGSYNDQYDDSQPNSAAGSPAKGEERSEDRSQNYGSAAREENRASGNDNADDHGAPQRNAGRDGEADE